jgi:hypothetical protein
MPWLAQHIGAAWRRRQEDCSLFREFLTRKKSTDTLKKCVRDDEEIRDRSRSGN